MGKRSDLGRGRQEDFEQSPSAQTKKGEREAGNKDLSWWGKNMKLDVELR